MSKFNSSLGFTTLASTWLAVASATAAPVYVDATTSNTSPPAAIVMGGVETDTDNLWFERAQAVANNGTILTSNANTEGSPMLTTTVSGLDPLKIYDVYLVFWSVNVEDGGKWGLKGGLTGETLVEYFDDPSTRLGGVHGENVFENHVLIGQVQGVTSFGVDVDDLEAPFETSDQRAWYDGVSYNEVGIVPEPSAISLLLVGAIGLLAGGRRRTALDRLSAAAHLLRRGRRRRAACNHVGRRLVGRRCLQRWRVVRQ